MQSSKIDRIKDLVEQLNAASESYYAKDQEIMSNYEYDKLYDELQELEEKRYPGQQSYGKRRLRSGG